MPLIDWVRTDLNHQLPNGAFALKYNHLHVCAFENFILKSKTKKEYSSKEIHTSKKILQKMNSSDLKNLRCLYLEG